MAHQLASSVNCSLDEIDLNALKVFRVCHPLCDFFLLFFSSTLQSFKYNFSLVSTTKRIRKDILFSRWATTTSMVERVCLHEFGDISR